MAIAAAVPLALGAVSDQQTAPVRAVRPLAGSSGAAARAAASGSTAISAPELVQEISHGSSPPVRDLPPLTAPQAPRERPEGEILPPGPVLRTEPDGALQTSVPAGAGRASPSVLSSFDALGNSCGGCVPPDTTGDVGPKHYVEAVNVAFAVYSKSGTTLKGPTDLGLLWEGLPSGLCRYTDDGDPIVVYDRLADRWLISQFAWIDPDNYHECVAISKTGDPTGAYWAYDFKLDGNRFNDYPKFGVWPDAYYASFNDFIGNTFAGVSVVAFDRAKMLNGLSATAVRFKTQSNHASLLPAHFDSRLPPPTGVPNVFLESTDQNTLVLSAFHADFANPGNSTFGLLGTLSTAPFNWDLCGYDLCIPQKGTARQLDPLSDRPMQRLDYRNFGGSPNDERLVVDQTVNVASPGHRAGIRWYELRKSGGAWSIAQQGTYAPDSTDRWMGSTAMDGSGDLAVGYSASSSSIYPSLRYAGRTPGDAAGTLQAETVMKVGGGSQTHSAGRWGDYTTMSVDPVDDCTFWYLGEYYATTSSADWRTRVGSFRFPSCVGVSSFSPQAGPAGTPLTVTGVGFGPASLVKVNGVAAATTYVSGTTLKAIVPPGATSGRISVATGSNSGLSAATFTVTPSILPSVTSFSPASGITGSSVTLTGAYFTAASLVKFNGLASPSFTVNSPTKLTAKVPNGAKAGPISVTTPVGTGTSAGSFTPTLSVYGFSPAGGPAGTTVTISGIGFNYSPAPLPVAKLNGTVMTVTSATGTQIKATVPSSATSGKITVQNTAAPAGTVSSAASFTKT